ncbi:MAG: ABC transporter permease [Candidatus Promineifilaceae bacterium]|jgi:ABC-type lipoprotein release transport system permease subunit
MAVKKFFSMAFRSVIRNTRRSFLTALAVALGLVVVMVMAGAIEGMIDNALADSIRVNTGHLQIRNGNYEVGKGSLLAKDLLDNVEALTQRVREVAGVRSATPILESSGLLSTATESTGIEILGIVPGDDFHEPVRDGIAAGEYLNADDRDQILLGQMLAEQMGITVGQRVSLAASDANGVGQEGLFTVVGLVDTGFPSIDQNRILMPLAQAQSFSGVGDRASDIIVMLDNQDDAESIAAQLRGGDIDVKTWRDLNSILLESMEIGLVFYYVIYLIVFLAVAVIIANTLLMSVFERTREIGILTSLGMNGRQIMVLILFEAFILAILGVAVGLVLGMGAVTYFAVVGISFSAETAAMVEGMAIGTTMKGGYAPGQFAILSLLLLAVVCLVSLYPAWYASRMEPVEALHTH